MYQGKYHQPAAPSHRRRRRHNTGSRVFYIFYAALILVFVVGMAIAMHALKDYLVKFEASQPKVKCQQVFDELFSDPDWAQLYTMAGMEGTLYEDADDFAAYMQRKTEGQALTFLETSAGIDTTKKKYNVKSGTEKIAAFTLTDTTGGKSDVPDWELDTVELFFSRTGSCTIQTLPGYTVKINGVELDDSHIIRTVSTAAESYLPEGVHGYQLVELRLDGLLFTPEVTVLDESGAPVELTCDEATGTYSHALPAPELGDEERTTLSNAAQTYCKYMIGAVGRSQLRECFDETTQIYQTITTNATWMQSYASYDFGEETISDFYRYNDSLYSARVKLTLNVTRKDGTIKPYELDTAFFLSKNGEGWLVSEMTNVDISQQTTMVRLTFLNGTEQVESILVDAHSSKLTLPAVTAPAGQVFTGWYYETIAENGNKTMTLAFSPSESGSVSLGGAVLEPMTLYALFESEGA